MAKLSANGVELGRMSKEKHTPNDELTIWERTTISYRDNGAILTKRDVRFKPDARPWPGEESGRYHSYGWKKAALAKGAKKTLAAGRWPQVVANRLAQGAELGYTVEFRSPSLPPAEVPNGTPNV